MDPSPDANTTQGTSGPADNQNPATRESSQRTSSAYEDRASSASACTACRERHLKCDGGYPCSRCQSQIFRCQYVRSRRGYKGPRRNNIQTVSCNASVSGSSLPPFVATYSQLPGGLNDGIDPSLVSGLMSAFAPESSLQFVGGSNNDSSTLDYQLRLPGLDCRKRYVETYFHFFHKSHPFLPPRAYTLQLLRKGSVTYLETAMCYIGSQYISPGMTSNLALELEQVLVNPDIPNNGFLVQALLLFAIGLDGNDEQTKALEVLARTQKLAVQLGMHQHHFAILNGGSSPVLEESWRRTWWELYVVSGLIAGLHQTIKFHLCETVATSPLPCNEEVFESGCIPPTHSTHTIDEFDDSSFCNEDFEWSSFTYRIAAVRNLGRVLQAKIVVSDDPILDRLDGHLVNWRLHLPQSKRECVSQSGQVDEMLLQAYMVTDLSSILLHRQFSQLNARPFQCVTSCASYSRTASGLQLNKSHSAKTIQSATDITKLIALPVSLAKHTPFFTCAIALASIVHLSCWSISSSNDEGYDSKEYVRLSMGGLKAMADVWPSAGRVLVQVNRVAQEIFLTRTTSLSVPFWNGIEDEDIIDGLADESIGNNLQFT